MFFQKHYTHALADFDKVVKYENSNASAHYNRGICLSNFKNYKEAKKAFQNAVNLNPKNELYYHTLGNCLRKLKKHKEAILMYEKGKEIKKIKEHKNFLKNEENEKESSFNNKNNDDYKNYCLRKVRTVREKSRPNFNYSINENSLFNHIKEVLKGESAKNLMDKLDFSKAVTMKNKLQMFNKNKIKIYSPK